VAIGAILCGVSGLAFAIGVYLPLSSMAAIYVGGCARLFAERSRRAGGKAEGDPGVLAASGLVAGEGLAGVVVAALVAAGLAPRTVPARIAGTAGIVVAAVTILLVCAFLYRAARSGRS
jgi:uncharacterized oligopeptide transporter (OPT) family protein